MLDLVPITPPRVPLIDSRTGLIERSWYMFFLSLFRTAQGAEDPLLTPDVNTLLASYDAALQALTTALQIAPAQVTPTSPELPVPATQESPAPDHIVPALPSMLLPDDFTPAVIPYVAPTALEEAAVLAATIHAATSKTTPVDADELPLADSASSFSLKKLTWANLKATLAAWLNGATIPASFTTVNASGSGTFAVHATVGTSAGDVFYADVNNTAVKAKSAAGGVYIQSSAGVTQAVFSPTGLAVTGTTSSTSVKALSAAGFISSDGSTGITDTVTTATLVGKTITIKDGIITGFA